MHCLRFNSLVLFSFVCLVLCPVLIFCGVPRGEKGSGFLSGPLNERSTHQTAALQNIKVFQMNVLGDLWADPSYYPSAAAPLLSADLRRVSVSSYLASHAVGADIIALAETTGPQFNDFVQAIGPNYYSFQAFHSADYWSNWLTPGHPWQPNGVSLFVSKSSFAEVSFQDVALSSSGNHAAIFKATLTDTNIKVRGASIHLDSDKAYNRNREFNALLALLPSDDELVDIIVGDFNTETEKNNLHADIVKANFIDSLSALGVASLTSPYSSTYYKSSNFGVIDHIIVRHATPIDGRVLDDGLQMIQEENTRITENIRTKGTDHYPVTATIRPDITINSNGIH